MARPRTPTAVLELKGSYKKHPERRKDRAAEPICRSKLGDAPLSLDEDQKLMWDEFREKADWLTAADSFIVEMASVLMASFRAHPRLMESAEVGQLKNCLSLLGLTPSDRSKIVTTNKKDDAPNRFAKRAQEIRSNVLPFKSKK